jgi:CRP-like cAMP-binding protein
VEFWNQIELFARAGEKESLRFLAECPGRREHHGKGEILHFEGDVLVALEVLLKGRVETRLPGENGDDGLAAAWLEGPTCLAPAPTFAEPPVSPVRMIALTEVEIHSWNTEEVLSFAGKNPVFLRALLATVAGKLAFLAERLRDQNSLSLKRKILSYLHSLPIESDNAGSFVRLPLSKEALAGYFGVARPSLSRCLKRMETEGQIQVVGRIVRWIRPGESF